MRKRRAISDGTGEWAGPLYGCRIASVPASLKGAAVRTAAEINPANPPRVGRLASIVTALAAYAGKTFDFDGAMAEVSKPQHISALSEKYFGPGGVKLTVGFMENTVDELKQKILHYMMRWAEYCNVQFTLAPVADADVRISRGPGGYYSYLGTDIKHIPKRQQTMNLEGFVLKTPDSEYERVVCHETGHCLAASTLIDCPRDLKKYPLGIPISELVGTRPWVYAWRDGRIVVRRASRVWRSKRNVETVRVRLRTGRGYHGGQFRPPLEIVGTPDHPILLADGKTWKNLGDLKAGDRLCSMYRSKNGRRSRITWTGLRDRVREHAFVAEEVYGPRPDGSESHHLDENQMNQSVENLEWKDKSLHASEHNMGRKMPRESVLRRAEAYRGYRHTDEAKGKMRRAHTGKVMSEEAKAKLSAATKGRRQSPELVEKRRQAMLRFYANGGRSGMFGKKDSEETRRKKSESGRAARRAANHVVVSVEPWLCQDVYDMTVPDADSFVANGVVVHNSLGFPHEHMRADLVKLLDEAKTIAYFMRTQGWSAQEVRDQVLTALDERSLIGTPVDKTSIMCYQLPGSITKDGTPIAGGMTIDATDQAFAAKLYPKPGVPVTPPAGGGTIAIDVGKKLITVPSKDWTLLAPGV
jgi:intein/homing endonuclease